MPKSTKSMVTHPVSLATLVLGIALVGLALWHWRANGWPALVWLAMMIGMMAIRAPYARRSGANVIVAARKDAMDKALLVAMFLAEMILPLVYLAAGGRFLTFADYTLPSWAAAIGAVLQLPFLWLFWRSHADLGANWSPGLEVREHHGLVTNGVYARIRHPMYAALWLAALTQPLLIHNWIAGALILPVFAAMWLLRTPREEAMMRDRFGAAYDAYCARTGRLVPILRFPAGPGPDVRSS